MSVGRRVFVIVGVGEMVNVVVGQRVDVTVAVPVCVAVLVGVRVCVGVRVTVGLGGCPMMVKKPDTFHVEPTNICTSYKPGCHWSLGGSQSVYP